MHGTSLKAVVIEDDPSFREFVTILLHELEIDVVAFDNGRQAIEQLAALKPDLVCCDLVLPELSGYDVCEYLRRTPGLSHVPVLMISSRSQPTDRAHAEEAGATSYLVKPFKHEEFKEAVAMLLLDSTLASGGRR